MCRQIASLSAALRQQQQGSLHAEHELTSKLQEAMSALHAAQAAESSAKVGYLLLRSSTSRLVASFPFAILAMCGCCTAKLVLTMTINTRSPCSCQTSLHMDEHMSV